MSEADVDIPGYRLLSRLSAGGMATVYVAEQLKFKSRHVAIKVFRNQNPDHTRDRHKRFEQEALFARSLQHPHIVQIFDYGSTDSFQFLVMEYLAHGDLKARLREGINVSDALVFLRQMASALQVLHGQGIVHRDIKPANILFRTPEHAVLADFGIARAVDQSTQLTQMGFVLGTPSYMSPEQINGSALSARSDIYALGVVLYEMLTGQQPYRGESVQSVATQHLMAPVPQLPLDVRRLQPLLNTMMAKKPADRITDATALLQLLDKIDTSRSFAVSPPSFVQRHAKKLAAIAALFIASVGITWLGVSNLPRLLENTAQQSAIVIEEALPAAAIATPAPEQAAPVSAPASAITPPVSQQIEPAKPAAETAVKTASNPAVVVSTPSPTTTAVKPSAKKPQARARQKAAAPNPASVIAKAEPAAKPEAEVITTPASKPDDVAPPAPVQSAGAQASDVSNEQIVEKAADVQPAAEKTEAEKKTPARKPPPVISYF